MTNTNFTENINSNKKTARLAGLFFLLMVAFGLFAEIFFREKIFVSKNIVATASNILSNVFLYRIGIVSDILMSLSYLLTALILYKLLSSVNKNMAAAMVIFATAGSVLLMFNILNEFAPLYILSGNECLSAFNSSQLQSLAMLFYNSYEHGYMIGQIFFALWVLPLGVLIYKSGFIPKVFGILFVIETIFGLMAVIVHFLVPNGTIETTLLMPGAIAEFSFMFWLLIRGINELKVKAANLSEIAT
jgi:hypothetical protein